ncbi:MAG TPA: hypothetical protein VHY09_01785 [Candidatus Methylacidiphilales bacterium]|jgi:hypothetical protein|nr:hypothetical protein [Candidatus Methylacidiphilales bacterium]
MHGSRAICLLMALVAALAELVSAAFGHDAKAATLADAAVNEIGGNTAAVVAEPAAPVQKLAVVKAAKVQNFSMSPLEMRVIAYAPHLRVIGSSEADSRQMASLADANERQLLFVKITLG